MHNINKINKLLLVENIMGIYRNYSVFKRRTKYLVALRIILEVCALVFASGFIIYTSFFLDCFKTPNCVFSCYYILFQTVNSIFTLVWSPFNSNHFEKFALNIANIQKLYPDDFMCKIQIKKRNIKFYCNVTLFSVAIIFMTLVYAYDSFAIYTFTPPLFAIMGFISKLNHHYRYFYENFVFFELIGLVIEPLKLLNESVSVSTKKISGINVETETEELFTKIRDNLEKWGETSQFLIAATKCLRDCFGAQITLSLCSVTFYFIALLYDFIGYSVRKHKLNNSMISTLFSLLSYLILKLSILSVGQRAQNQAEKLRRNIASLHGKLVGSDEAAACARAAARLTRRLRVATLRVRLLSSLVVQMALLAGMISLIANYTIVLLQFNHVV